MNTMTTTFVPKIRPIRFCTGGCSTGQHAAHYYATDPVDGPLGREYLCPGNMQQALETLDDETGEPTFDGFIAEEHAVAISTLAA